MKNWLFPLVFIGVGGCVLLVGLAELNKAKQSLGWPAVRGTVISSTVERRAKRSNGKLKTTYSARVVYEYVVEATTYSADTISFGQLDTSDAVSAQFIINRYPPDGVVSVHYNPERPDLAVLEPGVTWGSYILACVGGIFALAGVSIFFGKMR